MRKLTKRIDKGNKQMIVLRILFIALFSIIAFISLMTLCCSLYSLFRTIISKSEKSIERTDERIRKETLKESK